MHEESADLFFTTFFFHNYALNGINDDDDDDVAAICLGEAPLHLSVAGGVSCHSLRGAIGHPTILDPIV